MYAKYTHDALLERAVEQINDLIVLNDMIGTIHTDLDQSINPLTGSIEVLTHLTTLMVSPNEGTRMVAAMALPAPMAEIDKLLSFAIEAVLAGV